jgi:PAS domain S-box-containing protein
VVGRLRVGAGDREGSIVSPHHKASPGDDVVNLALESSLCATIIARALRDGEGRVEDFECEDANQLACGLVGVNRDELVDRTIRGLLPEESATQLIDWLRLVIETRRTAERHDLSFYNSSLRTVGRFDVRAAGEGEVVSLSFRDLAEEREMAEHYRWLLENSSDIVVRTDVEGRVLWIFDAVINVLGYTPVELKGLPLQDLLHPEEMMALDELTRRLEVDEVARFRLRVRGKDGTYHHFSVLAHRVLDDTGTLEGAVAGLHLIDEQVAVEVKNRETEDRYDLMARFGTDVIALERHGAIEWVSPYVERLLKVSRSDVVGKTLADLVHPDDRTSLQSLRRSGEEVESLALTVRMRTGDATYHWVSIRSRETLDATGSERIRMSSWRDAEDDVARQRALIASESRFRLIAENATDVVIECDADGVVHWVSPSALPTLGWRGENIVGTRLDDHVFRDDLGRVSQQRVEIVTRQATRAIEVRYLTATGNLKWVSQQLRQVRGLAGDYQTVIVGLHDIDELVALRMAVSEAESKLGLLADNVTDVVYTVNLDGELTWVSPSVLTQFGWQPGDLVGHSVLDLVFPEDHPRVLAWRELLHYGEVLDELLMRVRHASGHFVWVKVGARAMRDADGRVFGVVVALRNADAEIMTARALRTMSTGSRVLIRARSVDELLRGMCEVTVSEGGYALAWYGRVGHDYPTVTAVAQSAGHETYVDGLEIHCVDDDLGQGPTGRALRFQQTCTSMDIDTDESFAPWRERAIRHGFRSAAAIPVFVRGRVDGSWQVYAREPRAFNAQVLSVLEDLALEIGFGIERLDGTPT